VYLQGKEEGAELIVNNCDFSVNKHEKFSLKSCILAIAEA